MIKHVHQKDSFQYIVVDLDKNFEEIRGVQWADDETGYYEVVVFNEENNPESGLKYYEHCNQFVKEVKKGNIKIVRKSKEE